MSDPDLIGAPRIFDGDWNSTTSRLVTGTTVLPEDHNTAYLRTSGASGMWDGSNGGEISPDWVSITNYTVNYRYASYRGMTVMEDAWECTEDGDSGGAVYLDVGSSSATAVGIISGSNDSGGGTTNCRSYYSPLGNFWFNAGTVDAS